MYKFKINYFYIFSNSMEINKIKDGEYDVIGLNNEISAIEAGLLVNESGCSYCHKFKANKTMLFNSDDAEFNICMDIPIEEVISKSEYISFYLGAEGFGIMSNF